MLRWLLVGLLVLNVGLGVGLYVRSTPPKLTRVDEAVETVHVKLLIIQIEEAEREARQYREFLQSDG